ncbi:thiol:disulfide interchange protein DsbA/DsbL [Kingella negevensis]|uniref:thiol:disulfide interchange protein DsbA/DsbL n=1 Tax=Kingella negevensis TaxID=1522312 RepID=UPI00050A0E18|nr:thiol:disulfide interchange protein DsbA/DsbL [Kingella negevensis]MDK4688124.1 thiol:disulfide interchange protein DsbA/DsbL [Kingella negevensis]WII90890.1 thiol:disulfide interchange protein DsbA/DsbL [Kingella negevensis]
MKYKKLFLAAALSFGLAAPAMALTEGEDYILMPVEVAPVQKDKIEVTEFYAYWCPHCAELYPEISKHAKTFPSDTVWRLEHIVWEPQRDMTLARLAAAIKQTNQAEQADGVIFDALITKRLPLYEPEALNQWLQTQTAFDGKKVLAAYNSFSNEPAAKQMAVWTEEYGISGTPTVVVGGKYKVIFKSDYAAGMKTIDDLIAKVRQERGMPAPSAKAVSAASADASQPAAAAAKPVKSWGARLVQAANQ